MLEIIFENCLGYENSLLLIPEGPMFKMSIISTARTQAHNEHSTHTPLYCTLDDSLIE
jgi:hypothetical protein